jgi:hypothetical protein
MMTKEKSRKDIVVGRMCHVGGQGHLDGHCVNLRVMGNRQR